MSAFLCDSRALIRSAEGCLIAALMMAVPVAATAKPLDGLTLENSQMLTRGVWEISFGAGFGSGAELIEGPFTAAAAKDAVAVDYIRVPVEARYGWTDRSEIGFAAAFESNNGKTFPAGSFAPGTYFGASGFQRLRMTSKWKIAPRLSWKIDMDMLGNNALAEGNDGFDFGVHLMYGPKIGSGWLLVNTGVVIKNGAGDFNDNGVSNAAEDYKNKIQFGVGYVYPFTRGFIGLLELAGSTSPFEGNTSFTPNNSLDFILGGRFLFSERTYLTLGAGMGLLAGSPNVSAQLAMGWLLGNVARFAASQTTSDWWAPTEDDKARVATDAAARRGASKGREAGGRATPAEMLEDRMAQASAAFDRRDYVAAAAHYEAAVAMKPADPLLYYNLATTYFLLRRYFDAGPVYQEAARLNPADVDSLIYLGYSNYYMNNIEGAARAWKKALEVDPNNAVARQNLDALEPQ